MIFRCGTWSRRRNSRTAEDPDGESVAQQYSLSCYKSESYLADETYIAIVATHFP